MGWWADSVSKVGKTAVFLKTLQVNGKSTLYFVGPSVEERIFFVNITLEISSEELLSITD